MPVIKDVDAAENMESFERIKHLVKDDSDRRCAFSKRFSCGGKAKLNRHEAQSTCHASSLRAYQCTFCGGWHMTGKDRHYLVGEKKG